jgi:hypothetical protein
LAGEHPVFWPQFCEPSDITLAEIALEAFFPADVRTAEALRRLGDSDGQEDITALITA